MNCNGEFLIRNGRLVRYNGKDKEVFIPVGVKSIGVKAFGLNKAVERIVIPHTTRRIGKYAFYLCESLREVDIPDSVTVIDDEAFSNCRALAGVKLPMGLKRINPWAFNRCAALSEIVIPPSVKEIGRFAFSGCVNLENVLVPGTVENVESGAFSDVKGVSFGEGFRKEWNEGLKRLGGVTDSLYVPFDSFELLDLNLRPSAIKGYLQKWHRGELNSCEAERLVGIIGHRVHKCFAHIGEYPPFFEFITAHGVLTAEAAFKIIEELRSVELRALLLCYVKDK